MRWLRQHRSLFHFENLGSYVKKLLVLYLSVLLSQGTRSSFECCEKFYICLLGYTDVGLLHVFVLSL